jgi:hypothetical protein
LQKKSTGVKPHYLDVWLPAHDNDEASTILSVMRYLLYICTYLLNILQEQYTQELRKIHGDDLEVLQSVPFNPDATYVAGRGTPHERYVKISIVFC